MSTAASGSRTSRPHTAQRDDTPHLTFWGVVGMCLLILVVMVGAVFVANAGAAALDQLGRP
ncbi:MAG: hypothetical protein HY829_10585 [Actinobacteria bacterium]|nr:hypothetical protein [Actinomycetota bacterium]